MYAELTLVKIIHLQICVEMFISIKMNLNILEALTMVNLTINLLRDGAMALAGGTTRGDES